LINLNISDIDDNGESGLHVDDVRQKREGNPLVRMLRKVTKKKDPEKMKNVTVEMLQPIRYKPTDLNQMAEGTKFSKSIILEHKYDLIIL
jgi:hypothetical protein